MIHWVHGRDGRDDAIRQAEAELGVSLHSAAKRHLSMVELGEHLPYPRLERHDGYLFGVVQIPSDTENPSGDVDRVVFAVTHDGAVAAVTAHPTSKVDWHHHCQDLQNVDSTDSTPDGGQFLFNLFKLAVDKLSEDARSMLESLRSALDEAVDSVDLTRPVREVMNTDELDHKSRRTTLRQLRARTPVLSAIEGELPGLQRIADETLHLLRLIIDNDERADLRTDRDGNARELFSRELEIDLIDTFTECRLVAGTIEQIKAMLHNVRDLIEQLGDEENVAAGRFTGAIASIMLLPTFIVGLYGQNFIDMPETRWHYGYLFSWGTIVLLTVFQVRFFRRRDWL